MLDAATRTRVIGTDLAVSAWLNRMLIGIMVGYAALAAATTMVMAALTLGSIVRALTGSPIPYVPALGWVTVVGGTPALALVATIWPVRQLLRTPPLEHIGVKE